MYAVALSHNTYLVKYRLVCGFSNISYTCCIINIILRLFCILYLQLVQFRELVLCVRVCISVFLCMWVCVSSSSTEVCKGENLRVHDLFTELLFWRADHFINDATRGQRSLYYKAVRLISSTQRKINIYSVVDIGYSPATIRGFRLAMSHFKAKFELRSLKALRHRNVAIWTHCCLICKTQNQETIIIGFRFVLAHLILNS